MAGRGRGAAPEPPREVGAVALEQLQRGGAAPEPPREVGAVDLEQLQRGGVCP